MSADDQIHQQASGAAFGACCNELHEAIHSEDFEPLITLGPDGVLYMSVGLIELEGEEEPGMVDHPIFFCPFCGSPVQSRAEVQAKHDAALPADELNS